MLAAMKAPRCNDDQICRSRYNQSDVKTVLIIISDNLQKQQVPVDARQIASLSETPEVANRDARTLTWDCSLCFSEG